MENGKVKQVLSGGWHQWERGRYNERVQEGEYSENTMNSHMKMKNESC
jgi:hypothetical protein